MKVNISEWNYKPPTEKIDKWVIYLIKVDEKIIMATTKDINTVYKYPLDIIQWAIMEIE